jgi:hypothetical protein
MQKKCITISITRGKHPIEFDYHIGGYQLEDLGVVLDSRMTFLNHVESIISKSVSMLGFIKRISKEFNDNYIHLKHYLYHL